MPPFRYHVFACEQRKPEGLPCCAARGSLAVIEALRREVAAQGLLETVQVTTCGSIGLCERGPNLVVYPEGVFYSGLTAADVPELVREHLAGGRPLARLVRNDEAVLKAEITENRRRMVEWMKAREAAGAVPDELMRTVRGYQESRVVLTALELDLFSAVGGGAIAEAVAGARQLDHRGATVLLNALVALGLLTKDHGVYANTPVAARFLAAGSQDDARDALKHNLSLWSRWSTLTDAVRAGHTVVSRAPGTGGPDWTVPFIAAMHRNAVLRAPAVVQAVGTAGVKRLLDVGGGSGAYSIAFAQANPELHAEILDLPSVAPIAQAHVAEAGLQDRVHARVGDLRSDAFPQGFDLALLSAICHMLGPDENLDLLRRLRRALTSGGRLVIQDFVLDPDGTSPAHAALFALNMLVGTPSGGTYTEAEYTAWLREAGYSDVRRIPLPGPSGLMVGRA
ncbi:MAG TPA: methyltransferase [Vicinamibacteria bacterium]|nr:methyltransferase [Vicinamibacteria bacterium]